MTSTLKKEFIDLFKRSGWSQAEAARQLEVERATINGIVTGPKDPSETLFKLMRILVDTAKDSEGRSPDVTYPVREEKVAGGDDPEVEQTTRLIREIHRNNPADFKVLKQVIITYHNKMPARERSSEGEVVEWNSEKISSHLPARVKTPPKRVRFYGGLFQRSDETDEEFDLRVEKLRKAGLIKRPISSRLPSDLVNRAERAASSAHKKDPDHKHP